MLSLTLFYCKGWLKKRFLSKSILFWQKQMLVYKKAPSNSFENATFFTEVSMGAGSVVIVPSTVSRASVAAFIDWKPVLKMLWTTKSSSGTICIISNTTWPSSKNLQKHKVRLIIPNTLLRSKWTIDFVANSLIFILMWARRILT